MIYFDYNSTSPMDPRVLSEMLPYFSNQFGNAMNQTHLLGFEAAKAIEKARSQVSHLLGCSSNEVTFTSGATESNNWVLQKTFDHFLQNSLTKIHIISTPIEHSSVLSTINYLGYLGAKTEFVKVSDEGLIDFEHLISLVRPETKMISCMWVNNEIGTIQDIERLSQFCEQKNILLHCDATQAVGKVKIDLNKTKIDFLTFSSHKFYGPKGAGILYHREQITPKKIKLAPLILGGGHEDGLRSGTSNTPLIVGLGKSCEIIETEFDQHLEFCKSFQYQLWMKIKSAFNAVKLNGPDIGPNRSVQNLNITFPEYQVPASFPQLCVSKGSACLSNGVSTSKVLTAIGLNENLAQKTIRFSFGKFCKMEEIDQAVEILKKSLKLDLKDMSK